MRRGRRLLRIWCMRLVPTLHTYCDSVEEEALLCFHREYAEYQRRMPMLLANSTRRRAGDVKVAVSLLRKKSVLCLSRIKGSRCLGALSSWTIFLLVCCSRIPDVFERTAELRYRYGLPAPNKTLPKCHCIPRLRARC